MIFSGKQSCKRAGWRALEMLFWVVITRWLRIKDQFNLYKVLFLSSLPTLNEEMIMYQGAHGLKPPGLSSLFQPFEAGAVKGKHGEVVGILATRYTWPLSIWMLWWKAADCYSCEMYNSWRRDILYTDQLDFIGKAQFTRGLIEGLGVLQRYLWCRRRKQCFSVGTYIVGNKLCGNLCTFTPCRRVSCHWCRVSCHWCSVFWFHLSTDIWNQDVSIFLRKLMEMIDGSLSAYSFGFCVICTYACIAEGNPLFRVVTSFVILSFYSEENPIIWVDNTLKLIRIA